MAYDKSLESIVGENEVPDVVMKDDETGKVVAHPDARGATIIQLISYNGKTPEIQIARKLYGRDNREEKVVPFVKFPHEAAERIANTLLAAKKKIEKDI
jgi:hypothetical protein